MWTGTAASRVDLHPIGFTDSYANDVSGTSQVGSGDVTATGPFHSLLWSGTAASAVDLHPASFNGSEAFGVSGAGQVGWGYASSTGNKAHALLWRGTAASVVDLHSFLSHSGSMADSSYATDIDENGTIVGYVKSAGGIPRAVLWTPVIDSGVAGDYNNDGAVNAADYVMWRKGVSPLFNEVGTIGSNTPQDYDEWFKRFGNGTSGAGATVAPEPSSVVLLLFCIARLTARMRPRATGFGL